MVSKLPEPLAARREAALIAMTLEQLDGGCREGLRNYALVLHNVKLSYSNENSRRVGLLRPDYMYSEKSQGRRAQDSDGKVTAAVKVDYLPVLRSTALSPESLV